MVELDGPQDEEMGPVVEEFGSAIKKRGVLLIAFDNQKLTVPESKAARVPLR